MKLGLAAIDAVCERLGRPERQFPSALVAGTNGKGSTAASLSALARAAGVRAGFYSSPHLVEVTERIRVNDEDVSVQELEETLSEVFAAADRAPEISVTYFEALTAAAFLVFRRRSVGLAILEVGLGGRFDATNVAPASLAVVTSIGLDHTQELGGTLPEIAREKAGVFRRDRPALARTASPDALAALRDCAAATGALWHDAREETEVRVRQVELGGTTFDLVTPATSGTFRIPLAGAHQAGNAGLAVRAAELLPEVLGALPTQTVADGLSRVRWPGRLESVRADGRRFLLDGCHNPEGAAAIAAFLEESGLAGRCPLVFGSMADKDVESIARELFPRVSGVWLVTAPSGRAATGAELFQRAGPLARDARICGNLREAIGDIPRIPAREPIIVAGSLYLVGEARALLLAEGPETR